MLPFCFSHLFSSVINMSISASIVILVILLIRLALRKAPKIFSYVLWAAVLFRLLCPITFTADFSLLRMVDASAIQTVPHTASMEYLSPSWSNLEEAPPTMSVEQKDTTAVQNLDATINVAPNVSSSAQIAALIWLVGICIFFLYGIASYSLLRRKLIGAVAIDKNVYSADHIPSPFVLGMLHPKIYLPSNLQPQEQIYILLHERHHIQRKDHIVKALAFLALCIHWFNPLIWLAFFLSGKDMEMSCDEAVIKRLGNHIRRDYSTSLLRFAMGKTMLSGTPLAFGEGDVKTRIRNLAQWRQPKRWIPPLAAILCLAVVAACTANPRQSIDMDQQTYASMEDFAQQIMEKTTSVNYYGADGIEKTANVLDSKIAWLEKQGEIAGLAPEGILEAWTFNFLVQIDASPQDISLVGGMYEENGWYDLEGQGGHNIVALRHKNGEYQILYNQIVNDNMNFYGLHNNYEEALYDWYIQETGSDLPPYIASYEWVGSTAADYRQWETYRYDGNGWYLYLPFSWAAAYDDVNDVYQGQNLYQTSSGWTLSQMSEDVEDVAEAYIAQGSVMQQVNGIAASYAISQQQGNIDEAYLFAKEDGGCYILRIFCKEENADQDYPLLYTMVKTFSMDSRIRLGQSPQPLPFL